MRAWLEAASDPEPLLVETSGSTGEPKRVALSRTALLASAQATHARLGGTGTWLLALPAEYVAGLQVILRSLAGGAEPVVVADYASLAEAVTSIDGGRRYLSLVSTQLHRMLSREEDVAALARLDAVLLGGGPVDPELRVRAEELGIPLVATYGSSETSGGCVYDGHPLDGVLLDVDDEGRIRVGGPTLFDGYDDNEELTRESLQDGWFLTADCGRWDGKTLTVVGRIDDVVISGGANIPTPTVAERLRSHAAIEAAEVLGVPDEEWGQRVVAFVVTPSDLDLNQIRDWVATEYERAWAPRQLVRLAEIPLLENGKPDRVRLGQLAQGEWDL